MDSAPAVSVTSSVKLSSGRSTPSRVVRRSPGWAWRVMIVGGFAAGPGDHHVVIEGVQRLADLEHDVVGGVHDAVDRAHARQAQAALHQVGAGLGVTLRARPSTKRGLSSGLVIWMLTSPAMDGPSAASAGAGLRSGLAGHGGQLARHTQHAGIAGHVGGDRNLEDGIAHVVDQGHAGGRVVIQDDHALVLVRDAQLFFGADHRERFDAADFGALERGQHLAGLVPVVDARAFFGVGHLERFGQRPLALVRVQVGRAGQHDDLARAIIQPAQHQPVGVGVRHDLVDLRHHDLIRVPRQAADLDPPLIGLHAFASRVCLTLGGRDGQPDHLNFIHFQAGHGQRTGQLDQGKVDIYEIFQPRQRYFHSRLLIYKLHFFIYKKPQVFCI